MPEITGDAAATAFWDTLTWRPIADYDRAAGDVVLFRREEAWAIGFWGEPADGIRDGREEPDDAIATWRDAQDSMDEVPLRFDPAEFAVIDVEWRERLMAD